MQNKDQTTQMNHEYAVSSSLRTQHMLDFLEKQLAREHEPSHKDFRKIITSVLNGPEVYRALSFTVVAGHFTNGMLLHLLDLMATFQEKAGQEGISSEEYQATLDDVLPKIFQTIEAINKQISARSLDQLIELYNITIKLYTFSNVSTAEEAQKWLYELPTTYTRRLRQAGLLLSQQPNEHKGQDNSPTSNTNFTDWQTSYTSNKNQDTQEIGETNFSFSISEKPLTEPILIEIDPSAA